MAKETPENTLTLEKLKEFFDNRPAMTVEAFNREAGLSRSYLGKILQGKRNFSKEIINKITPLLEKYGYREE